MEKDKKRFVHIQKINSNPSALDGYFSLVYNPFVGNIMTMISTCEIIFKDAFDKLNITYGKKTFGQKINFIKNSEKIKQLLDPSEFKQLISSLEKANNYYNIVKHGHPAVNESCLNISDLTKVNVVIFEDLGKDEDNKYHEYDYMMREKIIQEIKNTIIILTTLNKKVNERLKDK